MKKRKWYSVSKTFIVVLVAITIFFTLPSVCTYLWWKAPKIFSKFLRGPRIVGTETYHDADFGVILCLSGVIPSSKVLFYKEEKGSVKRIASILNAPSEIGRATSVGDALYFPEFEIPFGSADYNYYITILKENRVYRKMTNEPTGEFIVAASHRIFINMNGKILVFDSRFNKLKTIEDPTGRSFFHIYKYNGKVYALETSLLDTFLAEIDPDRMTIEKIVKFNFPIATDGNHQTIVRYNGKVYASGYDKPLKIGKKGIYVHKVIYELTDTIKPIYVYPRKVKMCNSITQCDKKTLYSEDPYVSFGFESFIPVDPENKEFVLLGSNSTLAKNFRYFLFDTLKNKFIEFPNNLLRSGNDDLAFDVGIYTNGKLYIATKKYLVEYSDGSFKVVDTFDKNCSDTLIFPLGENGGF